MPYNRILQLSFATALIFLFNGLVEAKEARPNVGIGFNVNLQKLFGDTRSGGLKFGGNPFVVRYNFKPFAYAETDIGISHLSSNMPGGKRDTELWNLGMKLGCRLFQELRLNPLFYLGIGAFNFGLAGNRFWDVYAGFGGGAEYFVNRNLGLNLTADYRYTSGDDFDGGDVSSRKDGFVSVALGLNYYIGVGSGSDLRKKSRPGSNGAAPRTEIKANGSYNRGAAQNPQTLETEKLLLQRSSAEKDLAIKLLTAKKEALDLQSDSLENGLAAKRDNTKSAMDGTPASSLIYNRFRTGLLYFEAEVYQEAVLIFKGIINEHARHPVALNSWYWLGESYYALRDYKSAVGAFEMVTLMAPLSPKSQMAQLMLGLSYWKAGDTVNAKQQFDFILKTPLNSGYQNLAKAYLVELMQL